MNKGKLSRLRFFLWPIHSYEVKKFLPLFFLAFFVGFNYTVLKNMKDSLLISFAGAGAEVIPFIKVWGIVPGAVIMTAFYGFLSKIFNKNTVFYFIISFFILFFLVFTFCFFPFKDTFHLTRFSLFLEKVLPSGLSGFIAMIRYWLFSVFYVVSELWSSVVLSMLFWGFANEITSVKEAGRFYALINMALNLASIAAGEITVWVGVVMRKLEFLNFSRDPWHSVMIFLTLLVTGAGIAMIYLYKLVSKREVQSKNIISNNLKKEPKKTIKIKDLFFYVTKSKYLVCIATIVLSYNLVIHLTEVVWKDQINQLYPNPIDFNSYMGHVSSITGLVSSFAALLITGQVIRKCGWTLGALLTPLILMATGGLFFLCLLLVKSSSLMIFSQVFFGSTPLIWLVSFGALQNILSRASKFTFFDTTKEMAFIPLSPDIKLKGKAAIDGVISRLGKSGGALIYQVLLIMFSSIAASINVISISVFLIIILWTVAVLSLGEKFKILSKQIDENPDEKQGGKNLDLPLKEEVLHSFDPKEDSLNSRTKSPASI